MWPILGFSADCQTLVLEIYLCGRRHYHPYHLVHNHQHQTIRSRYYLGNSGCICILIFPKDIRRLVNEFQKFSVCRVNTPRKYVISTATNTFSSYASWSTCVSQIARHRLSESRSPSSIPGKTTKSFVV